MLIPATARKVCFDCVCFFVVCAMSIARCTSTYGLEDRHRTLREAWPCVASTVSRGSPMFDRNNTRFTFGRLVVLIAMPVH